MSVVVIFFFCKIARCPRLFVVVVFLHDTLTQV